MQPLDPPDELTASGTGADPCISVVVPVYNQVALLDRCLDTLGRQEGCRLEAIVVDDGSPEDPGPVVARHPDARLLRLPENAGYAAANNAGLAAATGEYLLFLNSDTELPAGACAALAAHLRDEPELGGVAPLHRAPDGAVQRTCCRFPSLRAGLLLDSVVHWRHPDHPVLRDYLMADWDFLSPRLVEHAQTSCLMVRRAVYERIGGMDESLRLFYNDTDYCRRLHAAGWTILFDPAIEILHHGSASVGTFACAEARIYGDRYRYFRKWFGTRGGMAVRTALWSRVVYEAAGELVHGRLRAAARKIAWGRRQNREMILP